MIQQSLKTYIRWHRTLFYESIAVAALFTYLKFLSVGWKNVGDLLQKTFPYNILGALIAIGVASGLQKQFRSFLREERRYSAAECREMVISVILAKSVYMSIWLVFLFYPLKGSLYDHLAGYAFVLAAISAYSTVSAFHYPLFLFDIGLQLAMVGIVTGLNFNAKETVWAGGGVLLFGIHNLFTGRILSKTAGNLFLSQQQMEKSIRMAETANRGKLDFLAMMSHEIRTPMAGVMGMVDFLKETPLSPEQTSCMKTLVQCSETLLNTLNDVIDTAREESGSLTIQKTNCDIREVILAASRSMEHVARKKNLYLEINIDEHLPEQMNGDPFRLQQVLFNLLNNAIKFTKKGGVILTAKLQHDELLFGVTDTGIGISEEQQARLFKKFSQANASISQKFGGSGLGLSITKQLVELMGGKIKCVSREGKGTTFYFWIPYRPPVAVSPEQKPEAANDAAANILLVEDNQVNQMIAIRFLSKRGHHVILAENGEAALTALREGHYDIILMDSNMPGKSGLEIAHEIKKMGSPMADIPIIAVTANAVQAHIDACLKAGMVDHVVKPFSSEQLCAIVAKHVVQSSGASPVQPGNPAKQENGAADIPLPGKLSVFVEEFGSEYAHKLAQKSRAEMERLAGVIANNRTPLQAGAIAGAAHDLKSVSGYIGFERTQFAAVAVENHASHVGQPPLSDQSQQALLNLVDNLLSVCREDIETLKKATPAEAMPRNM
ncbi:MAG: response regulator [Alphaproteobacteria bacterium]|nr:MAG: response regulator [Alphaproteobacteria bacterium]